MTKRQLGNDNTQDSKQVNNEISQVVMCVMSADEEQGNGDAQKEFFGRRVLGAIVDLLPHIEVVKGAAVEVERNATDVVEHDVGAKHVGHVGQCPRGLLGDARESIVDDFAASDQDNVDSPGTFGVGPVGVEVREGSLVANLLESLGRLMVDLEDAARPSPPSAGRRVSVGHVEVDAAPARRFGTRVVGDGALE